MARKSNIVNIEIRYTFTEEERNKLGPLIARLSQDRQEVEYRKKEAVSEFNAEIKKIEQQFGENVNRLNNGWEMRYVAAKKYKNYATGQWEFYSMENFDLLKTTPFESYDFQVDVDHANETQAPVFTDLDEEAPQAEGTEVTNPALFERCLRELNHYRSQMLLVALIADEDEQIEQGRKIEVKINALEATLKGMQIKDDEMQQPVDDDADEDLDETDDEQDNDSKQTADDEPDDDTKKGLNQIAKDLGDSPIFPTVNETPAADAQQPQDEPKKEPRLKDDKGRFIPKPQNKAGRLTTQGEDGTPSPRRDDDEQQVEQPTE